VLNSYAVLYKNVLRMEWKESERPDVIDIRIEYEEAGGDEETD
jgi:hypothetical protein